MADWAPSAQLVEVSFVHDLIGEKRLEALSEVWRDDRVAREEVM